MLKKEKSVLGLLFMTICNVLKIKTTYTITNFKEFD